MKPIPVKFNIGPLQIHTYGIGLAITFWWAYRYFGRRLRKHGYNDAWLGRAFAWIIGSSIVGARAVSVLANLGYYSRTPAEIFAVWHGGLSSYGGLLLGVPTGLYLAHRWAPEMRLSIAADIVAPVLAFAWAIGRLLGPQLMVSGGGNQTTKWYGLEYAGQPGKRVPVPIFQSIECFVVWGLGLYIERQIAKRGGPVGVVATAVVTLYGAARFFDEYVLLPHGPGGVAVEVASLAFVGAGFAFSLFLLWRWHRQNSSVDRTGEAFPDPWAAPVPATPASEESVDGGASDDSGDSAGSGGSADESDGESDGANTLEPRQTAEVADATEVEVGAASDTLA